MLIKDLPDYCREHICSVNCEYTKECGKQFKTVAPSFFRKGYIDKMYMGNVDIKKDSEIDEEETK